MKPKIKKKEECKRYYLINDNDFDLEFDGFLIAEVEVEYTGNGGSKIYRLYQTKSGKYMFAEHQEKTDEPSNRAKLCKTKDEIIEFFGLDWVAKKLYYKAEISVSHKYK